MPLNLPDNANVSYTVDGNEWSGGPAMRTVSIDGKPIYDDSNRTVKMVEWVFVIEDVIAVTPPATIDAQMEVLRAIFSRNGGTFIYEQHGLGGFTINSNLAGSKDLNFGPKVKMTVLDGTSARGGHHYAHLRFEFTITLSPCAAAIPRGVMSANFSLDFDIDDSDNTKRTFNGKIQIALVPEGRRLTDSADNYREKFFPDLPKGFKRTHRHFHLNAAKNELEITVVDEQNPSKNFPPPGCVKAKFRHSLSNAEPGKFAFQIGRASGSYEMAKGANAGLGLHHFKKAVHALFFQLQPQAGGGGGGGGGIGGLINRVIKNLNPGVVGMVLPMRSEIVLPDRYGKNIIECDITFGITTSHSILFSGGMNVEIPDSDEDAWRASVAVPQSARGSAGLGYDGKGEVIFDMCTRFQEGVLKNKKPPRVPVKEANLRPILGETWPQPHPLGSWLEVQQGIVIEPTDCVLRHMPGETGESSLKTPNLVKNDAFKSISALTTGSNPAIFQITSASKLDLTYTGFAIRAGYAIPVPTLRAFAGRALIPANGPGYGFAQMEFSSFGPIKIYVARWRLRFMCTDQPFDIAGGWKANPNANQPPPQAPMLNLGGVFAGGGNVPKVDSAFGNLFGDSLKNIFTGG